MPQYLVFLLPVVVTVVSGWLNSNKFPDWLNAIISGFIVLVCAIAWAALGGQLVNDMVANIVLLGSLCASLIAGPLAPLHRWLVITLPSPIKAIMPPQKVDPVVVPAVQRASLPQNVAQNTLIKSPFPVSLPSSQPSKDQGGASPS